MSGKYFEDLEVGQRLHHSLRRTVTEMDNVLFCALMLNTQPLHIDEPQAHGTGAFALDGKMIDRPAIRAAQQVLDKARAAGKSSES